MSIFEGSCVALVTPFKNNKVDFEALARLIDFQIKAKTDAILVLGTTGESSTISNNERKQIIEFAKKRINEHAKLIVGTGSNNTKIALRNTKQAKRLGADGVLIVTPYYNKCTQDGVIRHYLEIAKNVDIPIILYNVPSRTGFNLLPQTVEKLCKQKNIIAIKEANLDITHITELFYLCKGKIDIYSGNDNLNHIFLYLGAKGVISVVANVFPKLIKQQCTKLTQKNALKLANKLYKISNMCFVEPNPIPVKFLLGEMGLIKNELRLPLTPLNQNNKYQLLNCFEQTKEGL